MNMRTWKDVSTCCKDYVGRLHHSVLDMLLDGDLEGKDEDVADGGPQEEDTPCWGDVVQEEDIPCWGDGLGTGSSLEIGRAHV